MLHEKRNPLRKRLAAAPNMLGLVGFGAAGLVSFPMVFSDRAVMWFNEHFVTMDVPEAKDLETMLEFL